MSTSCYEPTIEDLLGDPVTQAVMRADRVNPSELEVMLRGLAVARANGQPNGDVVGARRIRGAPCSW